MDFVDFNLAKKLKEKGFTCQYPIAMYNAIGVFMYCIPLLELKNYYDYDNFDKHDCVCPTISQVLKWLRNEKKLHIVIPASFDEGYWWEVRDFNREISEYSDIEYTSYEQAAIAGIEYVLNNLI